MGGGGGGGGGSSYDDAPQRAKAKKDRQKAEEQVLGKESYVQSNGNIVRSGSGSGVTTGKGAKARDDYREGLFQSSGLSNLDGTVSKRGRDIARMQLEYRQIKDPISMLGKFLPMGMGSALMGIGSMNRKQQLDNLAKGGQPQFGYTSSGRFVVRGVSSPNSGGNRGNNVINSFSNNTSQYGNDGASPNFGATLVSEDLKQAAKSETLMTKGRKRTRSKRAGQAGTAGEGVLVRNTQK
tara:strand:- start:11453 stop:12166 length:714 start_codon:yes stop_codon:yes gene_type:complete